MQMYTYPETLQKVISYFAHLPGIGKRTAERLAVSLMSWKEEEVAAFGTQLMDLRVKVGFCPRCGNYTNGSMLCPICADAARQSDIICVVEQVKQICVIEQSGSYRGLYHVLGGKLSPMNNVGPSDLRIDELRERLKSEKISEVLIALSPDIEGEATTHFLVQEFAGMGVSFTRIASGVPVGTDLSFSDAATLASAIAGRRTISS